MGIWGFNNVKKPKRLAKKAGGKRTNGRGGARKKWEKTLYSLNTGAQDPWLLPLPMIILYLCHLWQSRHPMLFWVLPSVLQHGLTDCQPWDASVCLTAIFQRTENLSRHETDLPVLNLLPTSAALGSSRTDPGRDKQPQDGDETEKLPKNICERLKVETPETWSTCEYLFRLGRRHFKVWFLCLDLPTELIKSQSKGLCNLKAQS